jgi:nitrate reductase NapE component
MSDANQTSADASRPGSPWSLPLVAFLTLVFLTLGFAPNFRWRHDSASHPYGSDFLQEWAGARLILEGRASDLYHLETFRKWQHDPSVIGFRWDDEQYYPAVYPPPHYAFFTPLAMLPYRWATTLWVVTLWACVFLAATLLAKICRHELTPHAERDPENADWMRFLWLAIVMFPPVHISIMFGQKSVVWLVIVCIVCRLMQKRREGLAGIVFGLLSMKPTLFFLLPWIMMRQGRWRFAAGASSSVLGLWGIAIIALPEAMWSGYLATLSNAMSYGSHTGYRVDWSCNLLAIANSLPTAWVEWGKFSLCVPLMIYVLLCVFQDRFARVKPEFFLIAFAGTILLSPHAYHYDLCILLLPILWMAVQQPRQALAYYVLVSFAVFLSSNVMGSFRIPLIALMLLGMLIERRLRNAQASKSPEWGLPDSGHASA